MIDEATANLIRNLILNGKQVVIEVDDGLPTKRIRQDEICIPDDRMPQDE